MRLAIAFLFVVSANYAKSVNGGCSLLDFKKVVPRIWNLIGFGPENLDRGGILTDVMKKYKRSLKLVCKFITLNCKKDLSTDRNWSEPDREQMIN